MLIIVVLAGLETQKGICLWWILAGCGGLMWVPEIFGGRGMVG